MSSHQESAFSQSSGNISPAEIADLVSIIDGQRIGYQLVDRGDDPLKATDGALLTAGLDVNGQPVNGTTKLFPHVDKPSYIYGVDHVLTADEARQRIVKDVIRRSGGMSVRQSA